ncbi:CLUMA_CG010386, isoform A [Clunio marinus]|uniref:CLUMA_CG010386, isoform A n=1 Tax=Clunio marinus TaxID=568069 RepID=A0A1J1IB89_9DIPT|nr:CLUMA_CG010386, isoform A [Clunio marinus]
MWRTTKMSTNFLKVLKLKTITKYVRPKHVFHSYTTSLKNPFFMNMQKNLKFNYEFSSPSPDGFAKMTQFVVKAFTKLVETLAQIPISLKALPQIAERKTQSWKNNIKFPNVLWRKSFTSSTTTTELLKLKDEASERNEMCNYEAFGAESRHKLMLNWDEKN